MDDADSRPGGPIHFEVGKRAAADEASDTAPPIIEVQRLSAWFGNRQALDSIDLRIARRRITAIIGPSGSGKSTLLRCINRLHETVEGARVEGAVLLEGQDVYAPGVDPVEVRRKIGMVFQRPTPFPTMTIYENVVAGLTLDHFLRRRDLEPRAEHCLRAVGLWDEVKDVWKHQSGAALSGGQQQRLIIARALIVQPRVLLMDEPASALDPISTAEIEHLMVEFKSTYTIVVVTHNLQEAARVSDDTAFLIAGNHGGHLVEFGPTAKLFTHPEKPETADYVSGRFG